MVFFLYDVDYYVVEVDDDLVGGGFFFNVQWQYVGGVGFLNYVVGDRYYMMCGGVGVDNYVIGDVGFVMYINGNDVLIFQVINFVDNKILECFIL